MHLSAPMTPASIALFLPSLEGGGAERVMLQLARGFRERGLAVDVVVFNAAGAYADDIPRGVRLVNLRARRALTSLPALVRYLRRDRPTVLVVTSTHASLVAVVAKLLARVPTHLVVRQAETFSVAARDAFRGMRAVIPWLVRRLYPLVDTIIAGSAGVADDLASAAGLSRDRIAVIPSPVVAPELFAQAREPLDHPWFAPGADPVVLGVGRLTDVKDYATLIRAFALVRDRQSARLLILGEGEERARLEAMVRAMGLSESVALPGFVRNPFAFMTQAAVFVLSSRSEGSPGALIQALACGARVVATDCRNGPREILDGGRFGRLVPVGDVAALAAAIGAALNEPRATIPADAWSSYSHASAVDRHLALLPGCAP